MIEPCVRIAVMAAILLVLATVSVCVGAVSIAPGHVARILFAWNDSRLDPTSITIIWELRLPRVLLAVVVGGGLGAAGVGYQGLFRNPLADPFVIGASSGAALGATIATIVGLPTMIWGMGPVSGAALLGALLTVTLVYGIASIGGQVPTISLLLAGVTVSSMIGALVSLLMFLYDEKLVTIFTWLTGSLSGRGWPALKTTTPLVLTGVVGLWLMSRPLDSLTFGEESAAALGLHLRRLRNFVVIAASLATAAAVAASGIIGFVGLIAPHLARLVVGARHSLVMPTSILAGAMLLVAADGVARTIAAPAELPVGVITALLGSPFFLYLLKTRQQNLSAG